MSESDLKLTRTAAGGWSVREATQGDRTAVEQIWAAQFDDPHEHCHQTTLDECFDPENDLYEYSKAYVAIDARDRVIGFGLVTLRNKTAMAEHTTLPESEFSGRDGYLYLSAVAEGWKQRGIGGRLFAHRLRWCLDNDANAVYGVAWQNPEGPTSDPLFEKFGFEKIADAPDDYYRGRDCPVCDDECDCDGIIYRRGL